MSSLSEVGDDIHVITTENWRLNSGLVVGSSRALVIDTGAGPRQGREILEAVRTVTQLPLVVLNTHAHYDHYMGNAVFERAGVTEFWSHRDAAAASDVPAAIAAARTGSVSTAPGPASSGTSRGALGITAISANTAPTLPGGAAMSARRPHRRR